MRAIPISIVIACLLTLGVPAAEAGVVRSGEQNGRLSLEARFDSPGAESIGAPGLLDVPGLPALRYERVYVALPPEGDFRVSPEGGEFSDVRGDLPGLVENPDAPVFPSAALPGTGFYPPSPVVVTGPFLFRKTRVIAVDCYAAQVDYAAGVERRWSGYRVDVVYTPGPRFAAASEADPLLAGTVANRAFVPAPRAGRGFEAREGSSAGSAAVPDPQFSRSANWVRITVDSAAVFSVDGNDLLRAGVNLGEVDPQSFRLFTRGGRQLERRDAAGVPFTDPDGSWRPGQWMTECGILVEGGEDGVFGLTDRVVFYGVGAHGWTDTAVPGAARHEYEEHLFAKENFYYLTWNDAPGFPGDPARMEPLSAAPAGSEPDITDFEDRLFLERNQVAAYTFGGDGWQWLDIPPRSGPETITFPSFDVHDLVTARPQMFRTFPLARKNFEEVNQNHHAVYLMNAAQIGEVVFDGHDNYESAAPYETTGLFLNEGANTFRLHIPRDLNARDFMYFDFYQVFYRRHLRARGDRLAFAVRDTAGTVNLRVDNFTPGAPVYLFDVSDPYRPRVLSGYEESEAGGRRRVRFSCASGENPSFFVASTSAAFEKPLRTVRRFPRDLRNVASSPHMLIICHPSFKGAADVMKAHRTSHYPYSYAPDIDVVTTEEIFENFSGGLVDPMAVRNYCKFLYDNFEGENGYPRLTFVLLLGDANVDSKNYVTAQENFLTTNLNLRPHTSDAYATDDWFAELEPPTPAGASLLQLAVGRFPAGSAADALFLVNRVIDYETRADHGPWRNRVMLVADDERTPRRPPESDFTRQTELIAHFYMAKYLEPVKIYLTEFPLIGSSKPASRIEFIDRWNEGALAINYIGHGSSAQMADEQVFLGSDVANLRSGLRLPIFMAFSCTIGDFGRAQALCLAEKLLLWGPGGAVAAITASEVSYIQPNAQLNYRVFARMSPENPGLPQPLGAALMRAKTDVMATYVNPSSAVIFVEQNNHKYNLLGDPALMPLSPRREIVLSRAEIDTLIAGKRAVVRGAVHANGSVDAGFNGRADLLLREPDDTSGYTSEDGVTFIPYRYPGGTIYRGTADVTAGRFEFSVKVPRSALTGPLALVRTVADNGSTDAVALFDSCTVAEPAPGDTTGLRPLDGAPRVAMGFKGGHTKVKAGTDLQAAIRDADGVNVLNTTPEGRMALLFDRTNLPVDVTASFQFDHGGTDTSGVLRYPLPELSVGAHQVVLKVADSFGLVRLDTLDFNVVDRSDYVAEVILNYPNPFPATTHFLVGLTDPAEIRLDIFTVSGKKIRSLSQTSPAGEAWIFWDGKDYAGGAIANGTYLYVARVSFFDADRPPLVLRGKVVKIE